MVPSAQCHSKKIGTRNHTASRCASQAASGIRNVYICIISGVLQSTQLDKTRWIGRRNAPTRQDRPGVVMVARLFRRTRLVPLVRRVRHLIDLAACPARFKSAQVRCPSETRLPPQIRDRFPGESPFFGKPGNHWKPSCEPSRRRWRSLPGSRQSRPIARRGSRVAANLDAFGLIWPIRPDRSRRFPARFGAGLKTARACE